MPDRPNYPRAPYASRCIELKSKRRAARDPYSGCSARLAAPTGSLMRSIAPFKNTPSILPSELESASGFIDERRGILQIADQRRFQLQLMGARLTAGYR
ncbi:MAG: hypothetical protein GPOALKHO_001612 [Sodalis sp.]|nr:MAG: hypothetical protein GPOALKHO_001612 [Sodalis sp.]